MSDFDGIEPTINLADGESFVGVFDRTKEVGQKDDGKYGKRYTFEFLAVSGPYANKLVRISGGARLHEGIAKALGTDKAVKLLITQHGAKGGLDSRVTVERAK